MYSMQLGFFFSLCLMIMPHLLWSLAPNASLDDIDVWNRYVQQQPGQIVFFGVADLKFVQDGSDKQAKVLEFGIGANSQFFYGYLDDFDDVQNHLEPYGVSYDQSFSNDSVIRDIIDDKIFSALLFEQTPSKVYRPDSDIFSMQYSETLADDIRKRFPNVSRYVLKLTDLTDADGVVVVADADLDETLKRLLKNKEQEAEGNDVFWRQASFRFSHFLVEAFAESVPWHHQDKRYDASMRVSFLLKQFSNGQIAPILLEPYWKFPPKDMDDASATLQDKTVSNGHVGLHAAKLNADDKRVIVKQFKHILPDVFGPLYQESYETAYAGVWNKAPRKDYQIYIKMEQAKRYVGFGEYKKAEPLLRELVQELPNNPYVRVLFRNTLKALGQPFSEGLVGESYDEAAFLGYIGSLEKSNQWEEALGKLNRAICEYPCFTYFLARGRVKMNLGQVADTKKDYQTARLMARSSYRRELADYFLDLYEMEVESKLKTSIGQSYLLSVNRTPTHMPTVMTDLLKKLNDEVLDKDIFNDYVEIMMALVNVKSRKKVFLSLPDKILEQYLLTPFAEWPDNDGLSLSKKMSLLPFSRLLFVNRQSTYESWIPTIEESIQNYIKSVDAVNIPGSVPESTLLGLLKMVGFFVRYYSHVQGSLDQELWISFLNQIDSQKYEDKDSIDRLKGMLMRRFDMNIFYNLRVCIADNQYIWLKARYGDYSGVLTMLQQCFPDLDAQSVLIAGSKDLFTEDAWKERNYYFGGVINLSLVLSQKQRDIFQKSA